MRVGCYFSLAKVLLVSGWKVTQNTEGSIGHARRPINHGQFPRRPIGHGSLWPISPTFLVYILSSLEGRKVVNQVSRQFMHFRHNLGIFQVRFDLLRHDLQFIRIIYRDINIYIHIRIIYALFLEWLHHIRISIVPLRIQNFVSKKCLFL